MRRRLVLLCLTGMLLVTPSARAQDSRRDEAARLMAEGVKLAEQHDEAGALAKFEAAYRVYPSPNALYNVARERQLLGKNLEAMKAYRECRKSQLLDPKLATMADQFIAELEKTTARLDVRAPTGAVVSIDGVQVDASTPVDVTPGSHTVAATALGKMSSQTVNAPAGQITGITLTIDDSSGPPIGPPKTEEHAKAFPPPTGAILLGGVGLVGLGLGVGFALDASSKNSDYQNLNCANVGGSDCQNRRDTIGTLSTVSVVSYLAGGALLAGGIVWWIVAPRKTMVSVSMAPMAAPGVGGFQLHGSF